MREAILAAGQSLGLEQQSVVRQGMGTWIRAHCEAQDPGLPPEGGGEPADPAWQPVASVIADLVMNLVERSIHGQCHE